MASSNISMEGGKSAVSNAQRNTSEIRDLNAARGVAAVIVLFHHISLVNQLDLRTQLSFDTVLNAHGAVIFFFVLSGFVLTASLARTGVGPISVTQFFVRRAFRIYPALVVAFLLACLVWTLGQPTDLGGKSGWYVYYTERFYDAEMGPKSVLLNLIPFSFSANPPTWSIFVELVGSLIIPILFVWFSKGRVSLFIGIGLFAVLSAIFVGKAGNFHYLNFMVFFAIGAAVFFNNPLATLKRPTLQAICIVAAASLLLCRMVYKFVVFGELSPIVVHNSDWNISILEGAFAFVVVCCMAAPAWRDGAVRLPKFLGDYSYSIYLLHFPVMVGAVWILAQLEWANGEISSLLLLWCGVPAVTLLLAGLTFHFVEKPFIRRGRNCAKAVGRWVPSLGRHRIPAE